MVTIKEIAKECGVSIATVSNVLNGKQKASAETERRVLDAVKRLGYKPNNAAKSLRSRKTGLIGIIAEDVDHFTVPPIIEGLMRHLEEHGYSTVLKNLRLYSRWSDTWFHDEALVHTVTDPALNEFRAMMTDGVIYIAVHERNVGFIPDDFRIPTVMTYALEDNPAVTSIVVDDEQGGYEAVKHLTERGHRSIGIIAGSRDNLHTELRLRGAEKALAEVGLSLNRSLVRYADWSKAGAYEEAKKLLEEDISAVFCMADRMAGGVYQLLSEEGKAAGRDLSVIGYDNQDISQYFLPGLTTVSLPLHEIGETASEVLLAKLKEPNKERPRNEIIRLKGTLVERGSVVPF